MKEADYEGSRVLNRRAVLPCKTSFMLSSIVLSLFFSFPDYCIFCSVTPRPSLGPVILPTADRCPYSFWTQRLAALIFELAAGDMLRV